MGEWFRAEDIAGLPGQPETPRGVHHRAQREGWQRRPRNGRGGGWEYRIHSLPEDTRIALTARRFCPVGPSSEAGARAGRRLADERARAAEDQRTAKEAGLAHYQELSAAQRAKAEARAEVLSMAAGFLAAAGFPAGSKRGHQVFCAELRAGRIALPPAVAAQLTRQGRVSLSYSTLLRWRAARAEHGIAGLAPGWQAHNAGSSSVPEPVRDFVVGMLYSHPHVQIHTLHELARARFGAATPHESSLRRFVKRWKSENASLHLYIRNPDAWKSQHRFIAGQADAEIFRLNQLWELDSTPADVLCSDGRYTIIGAIDLYSRRAKLQVAPTSKATAIAALTRRCLLDWGVPEAVKTDNGSDYTSHYLVHIFQDLGIEQILCEPFSPEQKPFVESFFKVFSHGLLELAPGYIGHSVADRKAIEARRTFAQRMGTRNAEVEIRMSAAELQAFADRWIEAVYHQNPHSGLGGDSPAAVARAWAEPVRRIGDERALDVLLCEAAGGDGWRTIGARGVQVENRHYLAPEMAGYEGQRVQVRLDPTDLSRVYVFREDKQGRAFLCVAEDPNAPSVDRAEFAARVKAHQKKVLTAGRKDLQRTAREQALETVTEEYLSHREAQLAQVIELPRDAEPYTTPELEEAARAAQARDGGDDLEDDRIFCPAVVEKKPEPANVVEIPTPIFASEVELYEHLRRVRRQRPLDEKECARLARAHRESRAVRDLMEIEGLTTEDFA